MINDMYTTGEELHVQWVYQEHIELRSGKGVCNMLSAYVHGQVATVHLETCIIPLQACACVYVNVRTCMYTQASDLKYIGWGRIDSFDTFPS